MKPLYTQDELHGAKSRDKLPLECLYCHKPFLIKKNEILKILRWKGKEKGKMPERGKFCSHHCQYSLRAKTLTIICEQCNKPFKRVLAQIKKSKRHFCSQPCAAKYQNAHKTKGTRVSKRSEEHTSELQSL